ncbi:MAG: peptidoglycan-associated lipoprotein Pal [bacterium]
MFRFRGFLQALFLGAVGLVATACGPTYPKCENDEHCAEKGEYCLNGRCQQCRENSQCEGAGMECASGRCQRRAGYCDESVSCPGNQKCRDNECGAECLDNSECTGNTYCSGGSCIEKPECGEGADNPTCPAGSECVGGRCQVSLTDCSGGGANGGGGAVYFDYDRHNIKPNQRGKLDAIAACLKGDNTAPMRIEGHCDERGTEEYNLALGERRADAARRYLQSKGVDAGRLSTVSFGENRPAANGSNEAAWRQNRRAEFVAQ